MGHLLLTIEYMTDGHAPRDQRATPGIAPPDTSAYIELGHMVVDGETFAVRTRVDDGSTDYDWISGPNEGYGFGTSQGGHVPTEQEHSAAIRAFLAGIDPETGYL